MGPIPAKYFWPGFVTLLLCFSVGTGVVAVYAANSDGGAEIVEGYELGAEQWEKEREQARENRRLGWEVDLQTTPATAGGPATRVAVTVREEGGEPVGGLDGTVELRSPAKSGALQTSSLTPVPDAPGRYRVELPLQRRGLWDFVVRLRHGGDEFVTRVRKEI